MREHHVGVEPAASLGRQRRRGDTAELLQNCLDRYFSWVHNTPVQTSPVLNLLVTFLGGLRPSPSTAAFSRSSFVLTEEKKLVQWGPSNYRLMHRFTFRGEGELSRPSPRSRLRRHI